MSYTTTQGLLSSPDPLNDSPTFSSPVKSQSAGTRRSLLLQGSSPRKQTFQLDVGDKLSPQKIRVTVEAEHPEGHINNERQFTNTRAVPSPTNYRVPTVRQSVRTTTTTVPVKGLSDSEDDSDSASEKPTRGRGRPRRSIGTPVPAKSRNRALTPKANQSPRRRRTLGDLVDGDDSEDWDFAIGAGVEISRGKGRSRSRSLKGAARNKSTPAAKQVSSPDKTASSAASKKGRGRRKTLAPEEIIIHEDEVDKASNDVFRNEDEEAAANGILAGRDVNLVSTIPAASADYEITAFEENDPKLLHPKFSPAKKTLKKNAQFSSRVGLAGIKSSTGLEDGLSDRDKTPVRSSPQSGVTYEPENFRDYEPSKDDENIVNEVQEFDTVLESEGFSMISVDSVPSLREHVSSPAGLCQSGLENLATAEVGGPLSLNMNVGVCLGDSFSSIAPEILEAATPKRKPSNSMLRAVLSSRIPGDEDSFSSIPPEILEAATPGRHGLNGKLLSRKVQEIRPNDDSFSSIPPAILEAATPAKFVRTEAAWLQLQANPSSQPKPVSKLAIISSFPVLETGKRSLTSSGLLTPNDTPSPTDVTEQQPSQIGDSESKTLTQPAPETCNISLQEESSIENSNMRSSPPSVAARRFTYAADSRPPDLLHVKHMETPAVIYSSPMLPPLIQKLPVARSQISSKSNINELPKQSLSPTVRAGRVLQDIAVASTSRSRTQSLGSPFKSPAAQRQAVGTLNDSPTSTQLSTGSQKLPGNKGNSSSLFVGFSDDTKRELRRSMLIGEEFAQDQKRGAMINSMQFTQEEDPFRNNNQRASLRRQKDGKQYILEAPSQSNQKSRFQAGLLMKDDQFQDSLRSESAMSWQAENAVTLSTSGIEIDKVGNNGTSEGTEPFQKRYKADLARERTRASAQNSSANPNKIMSIEPNKEKQRVDMSAKFDDMEEDIWQAEARNSSSILEEPLEVLVREDPSERPRRSKIPSPWRKNSNRLVYSDELTQISSPHQTGNVPSSVPVKPQTKLTQAVVQKQVITHDATEDEEDIPDSSIVWHIPQKLNFAPRPRDSGNLDLSALLASSPLKLPHRNSRLHSEADPPTPEKPRTGISEPGDLEQGIINRECNEEESSQDYDVESGQAEDTFEGDSGICSISTSDERSELVSEPSHEDSRIHYPTLPGTISLSPQKSCLRNPISDSPTKSVAFAIPSPPAPPLSATTWSKSHWQLIHGMYNKAKSLLRASSDSQFLNVGESSHDRDESAIETSKYLGKKIHARGELLTLEQWHLDIVQEFRAEVPGWDEGVIAKRLFAIIIGEKMRMEGKA